MQFDGDSPKIRESDVQRIVEIRELLGKKAPLRIWPDHTTQTPSAKVLGLSCALAMNDRGQYVESLELNNRLD